MRWLIPFACLLLITTACAPSAAVDTPVPTLDLIPATATLTPTPVPPTLTPAGLPAPVDLLNPTATPPDTTTPEALFGAALLQRDSVAAELVAIAQRLVASERDLPVQRVRLVDVRPAAWTDSSLNCPLPDSTPVPLQTDGYRILVQVNDQEYLFHTDVDRVVPCDPANEQLPEGLLPTEEPTAESTSEAESTDEA